MPLSKVRNILNRVAKLAVVAAVVVALRLLVFAGPDQPAAGDISTEATAPALLSAVKGAIPAMTRLGAGQHGVLDAVDGDGRTVAHVIDTTGMPDTVIGYADRVPVAIILSTEGRTIAIKVLQNNETPSYIERVLGQGLLDSFVGMTVAGALEARVDAVSGATMSSNAILSSVRAGLSMVRGVQFTPRGPDWKMIAMQAGAGLVLLAGFIVAIRPRRFIRYRRWVLVAQVIVPGFMAGTMLSTALFASWIARGPDIPRGIVPFTAFVAAALIPLFIGRNVWCGGVCPFGAASELASIIPVRKLRLDSALRRIAGYVGLIYLCTILGLLVVWPNLDLASFEPFAAFSIIAAPVASIVIFAVFLAFSIVCPRFWCRFLCPTGRILDVFADAGRKCPAGPCDGQVADPPGDEQARVL